MSSQKARFAALALGIVMVFVLTIIILLQVVPGPRRSTDYMVIGAVATFLSMLVLFIALLYGWVKQPNVFYKKRPIPSADEPRD